MGYACPVCEVPQRDGEHLANHLAFTAMLRGGAHADWLDDHVPDWGETDPNALADRVTTHADETEYDEVFEDTTDDHDHAEPPVDGRGESGLPGGRGSPARERGTPGDVMREARELTRQMYGADDSVGDGTGDDGADASNTRDDETGAVDTTNDEGSENGP